MVAEVNSAGTRIRGVTSHTENRINLFQLGSLLKQDIFTTNQRFFHSNMRTIE